MNSPPETGSPTALSTPSSGSPPPEEITFQPSGGGSYLSTLTSHLTATLGGVVSGASKRRVPPGGAYGSASSARDTKSRRRGDSSRQGTWEGIEKTSKKEKDELLDQNLVDHLRKGLCASLTHLRITVLRSLQRLEIHSQSLA